ncbi:MAG: NADH-quinone oxidoreductase subunit I, partial [Elusimicrobia bacterium CG08_land_8_20_14_0_20_51_18]
MIRVKKIETKELNLLELVYLPEIIKGLLVTMKHLFRNLFRPSNLPTISYPEEKIELPGNAKLRSRHRIKLRKDGSPKCVACMLCATICPAYCIHIEAGETENAVEKYPEVFDIDLSRCIMCGLCVEACPEDAIIMDTGEIPGG